MTGVTGPVSTRSRAEVARWLPDLPSAWSFTRAKYLMFEVDERSETGTETLLSLSKEHGVVPRSTYGDAQGRADTLVGYKLVRRGQIVMNRMQAWNGMFGLSERDGLVSPEYTVLEPTAAADERFLTHLLRSPLMIAQFAWRSRGMGTAFLRLHPENLLDTPLPVPARGEQRAIADYLDAETARIDALIAKKRRMIELLEERRVSLTIAGVSGLLGEDLPRGPSTLHWLDDLPVEWGEVKLSLVANLGSGHTPSRSHPKWWLPEECVVPWITTGEVARLRNDRPEYISETRERVSHLGLANSSATIHPAGTVVLCRTASAGYSGIMAGPMATSQDFATWTCGPLLDPRYLLLCLRAMRGDLLGRLAMGSTHQTIYMPDIQSLRIPLPPRAAQGGIVDVTWERLRKVDHQADILGRQLDLLAEKRQALITAAVTGELPIPGVAA